ncbi:MAG TPA: hypothetical protein VF846_09910 [Thermoanaerobaculia bacterium]
MTLFLIVAASMSAAAQPAAKLPENPIVTSKPSDVLAGDAGTRDVARAGRPAVPSDFPQGAVGDLLRAHVRAMTATGVDPKRNYRDAEEAYQASLAALRARAAEVAPVLARSYATAHESEYFARWAMVETLRELRTERAAETLVSIARSPVPPERMKRDVESWTVPEEVRIRVTAIEALAPLAKPNSAVERALLELSASGKYIGIQRAAIRSYLAAGRTPDEQKQRAVRLRSVVPKDRHNLITLATTNVRSVPHPSDMPERFDLGRKQPQRTPPPAVRTPKQ